MQKVLYVFGGEKASGAEIVLDRLMRTNKRVQAHLFISPGRFAQKLIEEQPYPVTVSPYLQKLNRVSTNKLLFIVMALRNYLCLSFTVWRYVQQHRITVVHANTVVPASYLIPAVLVTKILGKRIKWLWSDHDLHFFSKTDHIFARLNLKFYHATLAVSRAVKYKYEHKKHLEKVTVLYNGLDVDTFKPSVILRQGFREQHQISDTAFVFGIAGNLSARKGQLELMRVIIDVQKDFNQVCLLLAGGTTDEDRLYASSVLKLTFQYPKIVVYLGQLSDMLSFYNGCDVIVNNSNIVGSEPLGTTIYEAMACEKITIASDTGGSKEIIDHLKNGFIFKAEDHLQLADAVTYCVTNKDNLTRLRIAARKKVLEKFNIIPMINQYNEILGELIQSL